MDAATSRKGSMRIFISAGEASGDAYGAALVSSIRGLTSIDTADLSFEGIGGPKLKAEGVRLYADSSHWGAISIVQAAKVFWKVFTTLHKLKHNLREGRPGLLVAIDFGYANIRLCRYAKKFGWKVLYFVPPGSWRRDRQGKDLPTIADEIVTPFEWSAEILNRMGASAHWFGHPIKQLIAKDHAKGERQESIAVLPGSRKHELEMNLPVIAQAMGPRSDNRGHSDTGAAQSPKGRLDVQLEFALAPSVDLEAFRQEWRRLAPNRNDLFTVGDTYGVLSRAKAGIICSGTATLEAALCRCPMVVLYKLSPAMVREAKLIRMKRPKFISLPNILMDREIVPEIAGEDVRPEHVRAELDSLLFGEQVRAKQLRDFEELDRILGPSDAITKTAELALKMVS
jgi:lipid-A-disaccharide synthase